MGSRIDELLEKYSVRNAEGLSEPATNAGSAPAKSSTMDALLSKYNRRNYAAEQIQKNGTAFVDNLNKLVDTWGTEYNAAVTGYTSRFQDRTGGYKDSYLSDSAEALQGFNARKKNLDDTARQIENILSVYGDYLDADTVSQLRQNLKDGRKALREIGEGYSGSSDFFGKFADENEYAQWQDTTFRTGEEYFQDRLDWWDESATKLESLEEIEKQYAQLMQKSVMAGGPVYNDGGRYSAGYNSRNPGGNSAGNAAGYTVADNTYSSQAAELLKQHGFGSIGELRTEKEALAAERARYERGEGEWATYDEETGLQTGFRNLESDRQLAKLKDKDFVDSAKKTAETSYIPSFEELAEMDKLLYDKNFTMDLGPDGQTVAYSSVDGSQLIMDKDGNFHHAMEYDPRYTSIDRLGVYLSADSDQKAKTSLHGTISTWDNIKNQGIANHWDFLTPEEVSVYYGLKANSTEEADAYLQQMQSTLNHRYENAKAKGLVEEYEQSGWLHRLRMQGRTVLEQGLSGIASAVTMLGDAIEGEETDVYGAAFSGARYANTVRGHTAKKLDEAAPDLNVLGLSLGDIYQAGMSGVDSLAVSWIPGGSAVLGTSSAANQAMKLYQEGADQAQILGGAMAAGIVEMAAEAIPLDKLNALKTKDVYTWSDFLLNVAKQAGCEFVEESATEIANGLTDAIIRRSESDWAKLWEENNGDSWKVAGIILGEVLTAGVSGALSGAGTAGVVSVGNAVRGTKQTRNIGRAIKTAKGGVEGMKGYASTIAQNGNNKGLGLFASKLTDKSSNARVGKAYRMTEASVREQNKAELSKTLQEKGYSKKQADQIAEAAVSSAAGWRLTEKQQSIWSAAQSDPDVVAAVKDALTGEDSGVRRRNQMSEDFRQGVRSGNMANSQTVGNATPKKGETAEEAVMKEVRRQMRENGLPVEEVSGVEDPSTALRSAQDDSVSQEESDLTSPEMRQTMQEAYANDEITEEEYDDYLDAMMEQQGMDGVVEEEAQLREKAEAVKRAEEQATVQGIATPAAQARNDNGNMNGGTDNGTGVLHGSGQRNDRASAGEPAGSMAGRAGQDQKRGGTWVDRVRAKIYRQNLSKNLRTEKLSSRDLGVNTGTDNATMQVVPEEYWDEGMRAKAEQIYQETGKRVTYVVGPIEITGKNGKVRNAKGVITDEGILVRIDHSMDAERIADHEVFHGLMDLWDESAGRRTILDGLMDELRQRYDPEQLRQMLNQYKEALRGIYSEDSGADLSGDVLEDVDYDVLEEMLADAYAGLNEHGAGANRLGETVRTWLRENHVEHDFFQDNGTEQPTGPPAGQKENTAQKGGERYLVNSEYVGEIDAWNHAGKPDGEDFILGSTGDVLQGLGAIESDIFILGDKIKTILKVHPEITLAEIKSIPKILEDPVLILKSRNVGRGRNANTRLVVFGSIKAQNGQPVLTVLDLRPIENGFALEDLQKVSSAYTKTTDPVSFVKASDVLYADEKRTAQLLRTIGFQMPIELQQSGYIGSIFYRNQKVNVLGEKFSNVFTMKQTNRYSTDDSVSEDDGERIATPAEPARNDGGEQKAAHNDSEEQKDSYSMLPAKARDYVRSAERNLLDYIGQALSVPKAARRDFLAQVVRAITNEYLTTGTVSAETVDSLFQQAYAQGVVADEEFFNQYKHIKDRLRSTAVTLAEQDRSDIADFTDFRRQAGGLLKIRNEGGLPVDVAYQELQDMSPELFPDNITHPADQLVRMLEVAQSIEVSYMSLDRYYGDDAANFKRDARHEFENAVDKVLGDLRNAKRYMDDRNAERDKAPTTVEEAMEAWKELKAARRNYEKTMAKNLLTEHDQRIVGDLLYGKATLENLDPERDNVKGITAVYEAKREYAKLVSLLAEYKRNLKAELRAEADSLLETANEWKDKGSGLAYSRETMRRNVLDIVKDPEVADKILRKYFEPVAIAEAAATRFKDKYRERVAALNLSRKVKKGDTVSEAHAVQLLGEAMDNIAVMESARGRLQHRDGKTLTEWKAVVQELWESSPSLDRVKIEKAVQEFREIYDDLFQQMNQVRVQNGYEPVNYRKGYFPHFQQASTDGILAHFGRALGISTEVAALPTTINGLTHTFRPGIQWFGNALQRTGFATAYDAVEGFDKYIEGVASVIHQTENIQRLRALASQIRYRTSDDGIRAQVDKVLQDERLTEEEKHNQINSIYEHGRFSLSGFVVELDEYTNLLANKKSRRDREIESDLGRRFYNVAKWLEQRIAANMIAGNLSSALTNVIPLTQAAARMGNINMAIGMWKTVWSYVQDDGMVETSDFLTNRRGSDPLVRIWQDKVSSIVGLPMELIDQFVADSIVRGAYYQNLKRGLSEEEALHQADLFAASVMADRSKGAMPTIFSATNPGTKLFTMFQLEVNNQFSEVFKDMPREMRSKGKLALAAKLLQYVLGAFLFNELFEALFGRRPALDPIGILNETIGDFSGYELPNLLELISGVATGNTPSFKTEKAGVGQSILNLGENILGELPFNSALGLVGIGEDSRIPVESALPDVTKLINAATNSEWAPEKRWKTAIDELAKPVTYLAPPFGGNQLSKTVKGIIAAVQGGSYTVDNKGRDILQYPVFDDPFSVLRAAIMGKNSVPEGQDWVDDGFDSFSAKATATYQGILDVGVDDREAYALVDELRHAKKTNSKTKEDVQRDILRDSDISAEAKVVAYCGMVATESELEWMNRLLELDPDAQSTFDVAVGLKEASALKGDAVRQARAEAIADTALTQAQKIVAVESFLGNEWQTEEGKPTTYAKFRDMLEAGLTVDDFMELYAAGADSSDMDKFLGYIDSGLGAHEAMSMLMSVSALKPAEGKTSVSNVQKWRAAVDSQSGTEDQLTALSAVMDEKTYQKVELANGYGVKPDAYVGLREILPKYDEDGNSSYNQKEIAAAVNAVGKKMNLTTEQKAVLWQIVAGTKSAKNNPYSVEIGWKVVDALSDETLSFGEMFMRQVMANM